TLRQMQAAGLAGVVLLAGHGVARAQTTGYTSGTGSSGMGSGGGGSVSGGGTSGGGTTGVTGTGNQATQNQLPGTGSSNFLSGAGQMVAPSTLTFRTSTFFTSGTNNPFASYYTNPLTTALGTNSSGSSSIGASIGGPGGGRGAGGFGMPLYTSQSSQ